jgi:hypothetical protein
MQSQSLVGGPTPTGAGDVNRTEEVLGNGQLMDDTGGVMTQAGTRLEMRPGGEHGP